mmetsp:Transcript_45448/g.115556  ORF Transcript_45448/g.115556 Transcript_45448/m.115556 type:complete len:231 (+) Transcript_45448:216-908(+)
MSISRLQGVCLRVRAPHTVLQALPLGARLGVGARRLLQKTRAERSRQHQKMLPPTAATATLFSCPARLRLYASLRGLCPLRGCLSIFDPDRCSQSRAQSGQQGARPPALAKRVVFHLLRGNPFAILVSPNMHGPRKECFERHVKVLSALGVRLPLKETHDVRGCAKLCRISASSFGVHVGRADDGKHDRARGVAIFVARGGNCAAVRVSKTWHDLLAESPALGQHRRLGK